MKIITCSRYSIEVLLVPIIPSKYVCFLILVEVKIVHAHLTHPAFVGKNVYCECTPFICNHNHHHHHHSFDFQLTEGSEVFQEVSGGKLTTYKKLCSLANEMSRPDLIYKCTDLANYQASLNSKWGAPFNSPRLQSRLERHFSHIQSP